VSATSLLAAAEAAYLRARDVRDRLDVARATGEPPDAGPLEAEAAFAEAAVREAMGDLDATAGAEDALSAEDRRALAAVRAGIAAALGEAGELSVTPTIQPEACANGAAWAAAIEAGGDVLHRRLEACYGAVAGSLRAAGETLTRPQVLARLTTEPDPAARRRLFGSLEPLWRTVDGDGGERSPYRALLRESASRWAHGTSPIEANAGALGVSAADIEAWAMWTLRAWRDAVAVPAAARGEPPIQPWDWWWRAGEADRALRASLPRDRLFVLNRDVHGGLGADLDDLAVRLDTTPRPGRPQVPVAFTTFGARPHRRADGTWDPGRPTVLASYTDGGLGELTELVHETGHAIHIAAIRTRPAFADWPDSDALTEALAELVSLDVAEPAFARRWLPEAPAVPEAVRYAAGTRTSRSTPRGPCSRSGCTRTRSGARTRPGRSSRAGTWGSRHTRSGRGGRCAGSSSRSLATWATTRSARCWRRTSGRRSAQRGATGPTATPAGTPGSRSGSTGSGWSGPHGTCCGTCSGGRRPRTRCCARSPGPALPTAEPQEARSARRCACAITS
jgi:hypothetical protein